MAYWELQLLASIQHFKKVCSINHSPGKNQKSRCEAQFLFNGHHFGTIILSKNCKLNHCKSGTSVFPALSMVSVTEQMLRKDLQKEWVREEMKKETRGQMKPCFPPWDLWATCELACDLVWRSGQLQVSPALCSLDLTAPVQHAVGR